MDRLRFGVFQGQVKENLRELEPGAVRRWEGKVASGFRLYCAENISRAAALAGIVRRSYVSSTSSFFEMYSSLRSATHHILFPPWLEVVVDSRMRTVSRPTPAM